MIRQALIYVWNVRTTAFGYIQVVLGVLAASDVLPPPALKYVILANAMALAILGHYNNLKLRQQSGA
jgi:hypothetical protein